MKLILLLALVSCATPQSNTKRMPASEDPTMNLINQFTREDQQQEQSQDRYCRGNPPGNDDAWCSWVCINGSWAKVCR